MTNEEIINQVEALLGQLKTPYIFIVRDNKDIRTALFPTTIVVGELLAKTVISDKIIENVLAHTMKLIKPRI